MPVSEFGAVQQLDIRRTKGDTYALVFTITANSAAIDITDYTFLMTADPSPSPPDDTTKIFEIVGVIVAPATNGRFSFTPSPADVDQVIGTYYYDVQATDGAGLVRTLIKGKFIIEPEVTQ